MGSTDGAASNAGLCLVVHVPGHSAYTEMYHEPRMLDITKLHTHTGSLTEQVRAESRQLTGTLQLEWSHVWVKTTLFWTEGVSRKSIHNEGYISCMQDGCAQGSVAGHAINIQQRHATSTMSGADRPRARARHRSRP